jgi:hypothetical protein
MHLQRIFVIFLSLIGIISTFLPWFSVSNFLMDYSVNGLNRNGWVIILLFSQCVIFCFLKDWNKPLSIGYVFATIFCSLLTSFIVVYDILNLYKKSDNIVGRVLQESITIEIGFYLTLICGFCTPLFILFFKNK